MSIEHGAREVVSLVTSSYLARPPVVRVGITPVRQRLKVQRAVAVEEILAMLRGEILADLFHGAAHRAFQVIDWRLCGVRIDVLFADASSVGRHCGWTVTEERRIMQAGVVVAVAGACQEDSSFELSPHA